MQILRAENHFSTSLRTSAEVFLTFYFLLFLLISNCLKMRLFQRCCKGHRGGNEEALAMQWLCNGGEESAALRRKFSATLLRRF